MKKISRIFRSTKGAFDLTSIMVGVLVLGIISAATLATVFGAIPWAQNNTAKNFISTLHTAEANYFIKTGFYGTTSELLTKKTISSTENVYAFTDGSKGCYLILSKSESGAVWYATDKVPAPLEYQTGATSTCGNLPTAVSSIPAD